ncbi:MAG TPA: dTMP kinase [Gammaproteobacteria bacterium]|nr:dTMP kinase [Gammaproteobacteria bacterium]
MTARGRLITFEGVEGVGKSTQVQRLADWLAEQGRDVVCTREPGGAPLAEKVRELLKQSPHGSIPATSELLLIFAARVAHADALLRPALARGQWVVCDRFVDASIAYQGAGRGLGRERVENLAEWLVPDLVPDLTLVLDLPIDAAFERLDARGERDRFEQEDGVFFRRVREAYLEQAGREPHRVHIVNASGAVDEVARRCRDIVAAHLTGIADD